MMLKQSVACSNRESIPLGELTGVKMALQFIYIYTQTKKKTPIFMVLYLSIQLRCYTKNKTKMSIKHPTHKTW